MDSQFGEKLRWIGTAHTIKHTVVMGLGELLFRLMSTYYMQSLC